MLCWRRLCSILCGFLFLFLFIAPVGFSVPVRTASDQPYRLRKFKLRLFYGPEIRQRSAEVRSIWVCQFWLLHERLVKSVIAYAQNTCFVYVCICILYVHLNLPWRTGEGLKCWTQSFCQSSPFVRERVFLVGKVSSCWLIWFTTVMSYSTL